MVAYTVNAEILSPAQRQELLLIRTNISPQPKAGDPECRETARMLSEIKEQMEELHLVDEQGRVVRQSEAAGHTRAEVDFRLCHPCPDPCLLLPKMNACPVSSDTFAS